MSQYKIELSRILKSAVFWLMAVGMVLNAHIQEVFPTYLKVSKPEPNGYYGTKPSNDPSLIMPEAAESLFAQYSANEYTTYPFGYYKEVRLNQDERKKMTEIINELSANEISDNTPSSHQSVDAENNRVEISGDSLQIHGEQSIQIVLPDGEANAASPEFQLNPEMTWERFTDLMAQADQILGGGSDFSERRLNSLFGQIPVTYEEVLADYELVVSHDKLTGAHARQFSDYMGYMLGILPVFPTVFLCLRDRKNISSMLYTRRISSGRFILNRFLALATATMIPIFLMSGILTCMHANDYGLMNIDVLAYFKAALFWMFPTACAAISVGLFFTTLTNTPVAVAVQFLWWFIDGMQGWEGEYIYFGVRPFQLIPRHNGLGYVTTYLNYLPNLIQNRIQIMSVAVLLLIGTIIVFNAKRRGLLYVPVFKRSKIQSAV